MIGPSKRSPLDPANIAGQGNERAALKNLRGIERRCIFFDTPPSIRARLGHDARLDGWQSNERSDKSD